MQSGVLPPAAPTPREAVPGKQVAFSWALSALIKTTTRWRCRLAKERNAPSPAPNHPKGRGKPETFLLSKQRCQDKKGFARLPLPKTGTNVIIVRIEAVLPHQICQDRKLLLPLTSMRQLLLCTSNTGATCFPSHERHCQSRSGTHQEKVAYHVQY